MSTVPRSIISRFVYKRHGCRTLTILQAVAGDLTIKVPTAAGDVDVVMETESDAAVGGKLTVTGALNVTITR